MATTGARTGFFKEEEVSRMRDALEFEMQRRRQRLEGAAVDERAWRTARAAGRETALRVRTGLALIRLGEAVAGPPVAARLVGPAA